MRIGANLYVVKIIMLSLCAVLCKKAQCNNNYYVKSGLDWDIMMFGTGIAVV